MYEIPEIQHTHPLEDEDDNLQIQQRDTFNSARSTFQSCYSERNNILLLLALYTVQGLAISFYENSLELIVIAEGAAYTELGIFSLITLPFSFKIIFAPFLDIYYIRSFGKRKTYIVPILYILGAFILSISFFIDGWVQDFSNNIPLLVLTGAAMMFITGIQDIANDAWVITLMSRENLVFASLAQYGGRVLGQIFGYYFLIPLNSVEFCNQYLFKTPHDGPLITLKTFMIFVAVCHFLLALYVHFVKKEQNPARQDFNSLLDIAKLFKGLYQNKNIRMYVILLLTYPICLTVVRESTSVVLIRKGMRKDYITDIGLFCLPFAFIACLVATRLARKGRRYLTIMVASIALMMLTGGGIVAIYSNFNASTNYETTWILLLVVKLVDLPAGAIRSLFQNNFVQRMAVPEIAGSYITTLHAIGNFSWHAYSFTTLFLLDKVNLYILLGVTWGIGAIYLITFGRYAAKTLDAKHPHEFNVQFTKPKKPLYEDIPSEDEAKDRDSVARLPKEDAPPKDKDP